MWNDFLIRFTELGPKLAGDVVWFGLGILLAAVEVGLARGKQK